MYYGKISDIYNLTDKKAVVTGGTRGLGREMAISLMENGCDVVISSRNIADSQDMVDIGNSLGRRCIPISCDVTVTKQVKDMVTQAVKELGRIDILINSAGMGKLEMLTEMSDETWDAVVDSNLKSKFLVSREVAKGMIEQRYGKIINISSMKSVFGMTDQGYAAYCSAMGGINMFTKQIACELAPYGITANAIAPTYIETDLNRHLLQDEEFRNRIVSRIPVGRLGQLKDMVSLMLFLATDASEFVTGQTILLDGGIAARQ